MAEETSFEPSRVLAISKQVYESGDRFSNTVAMLVQKCVQLDGCWGNDEFGNAFAQNYKPAQGTMLDNGRAIVAGVTIFSNKLTRAVEALQQTDQNNANNL